MAAPEGRVNLAEKLTHFERRWSPHIIAEFNGNHVKVAKVEGPFDWHVHNDTDEVFLLVAGTLRIELEDRDAVELSAGDLFVVPRGVRHRPIADTVAHIALIQPADTPNTGDASSAAVEPWV